MRNYEKVDYGKAFDSLKQSLAESEKMVENDGSHLGYMQAYTNLSLKVRATVNYHESSKDEPDDIPKNLFTKPKS